MLCTVLQDGVYDLDGSIVGCVQWSPRQAQGAVRVVLSDALAR